MQAASKCLISWILTTLVAVFAASRPDFAAAPAPKAASDPLLAYLLDDDEQARAQVLGVLREQGLSPCKSLGDYAENPNSRVRANAVEAMDAGGCSDFQSYGAYLLDGSAGVVAALIQAAERHMIKDAVPFLIGTLTDRRRIVNEEGTWSLGEGAHRALTVITCQSFHFDPAAPRDDQRNAVTRWRQWYLAKKDLPREEWEQEGIDRARDYAGRDHGPYRIEGLRVLALIGPRALPTLRELLARRPGELQAEIVCLPDEPPRVTDAVPCALVVRNASSRSLVIAPPPDGLKVQVSRSDAWPADREPTPLEPKANGRKGPVVANEAPPGSTPGMLRDFANWLTLLGPGEARRFEFSAGPVLSAGRYRVSVSLKDLAASLVGEAIPADGAPGKRVANPSPRSAGAFSAIEEETVVRFEQ